VFAVLGVSRRRRLQQRLDRGPAAGHDPLPCPVR
jgi:hypothetical protein